jgi:hypothetical protein
MAKNDKAEIAAIRTEMAAVLKTTDQRLDDRIIGMRIGCTCGRCGGSGSYSYNQLDGDRCYGCHGSGQTKPKTKTEWQLTLEAAKQKAANGDLDRYLDFLRARKLTKTATDQVMAAWKASGVSQRYDWRLAADYERQLKAGQAPSPELREHHRVSEINAIMCDQFKRIEQQAGILPYIKDREEQIAATLKLSHDLSDAIRVIQAATPMMDDPSLPAPEPVEFVAPAPEEPEQDGGFKP